MVSFDGTPKMGELVFIVIWIISAGTRDQGTGNREQKSEQPRERTWRRIVASLGFAGFRIWRVGDRGAVRASWRVGGMCAVRHVPSPFPWPVFLLNPRTRNLRHEKAPAGERSGGAFLDSVFIMAGSNN